MRFLFGSAITVIVLLSTQLAGGQQPQQPKAEIKPSDLIDEWFIRWNELDGTPEKAARLVELYAPDAIQVMGPGTDQLGTLSFTGEARLKTMAENFGKTYSAITFRINLVTLKEKTAKLISATDAPWGGIQAAVELTGAYTDRATRKRYTFPGAAFFLIESGKIRRVRLYKNTDETAEVK